MKHLYFAYGANTNIASMDYRCPTATCLGAAKLHGYLFQFRLHADVEPNDDTHVSGVLWEVTDYDMESLDKFESYPIYYNRAQVKVDHNGRIVTAWVYFMNDQNHIQHPHDWYLKTCVEGYLDNGLMLDQIENALSVSIATMETMIRSSI